MTARRRALTAAIAASSALALAAPGVLRAAAPVPPTTVATAPPGAVDVGTTMPSVLPAEPTTTAAPSTIAPQRATSSSAPRRSSTTTAAAPSPTTTQAPTTSGAPTSEAADAPTDRGPSDRPHWVPASAKPAFTDEFGTDTLDRTHWTTCYPWADPSKGCNNAGNPERQWYLPEQVTVSDGALQLTADRRDTAGTDRNGLPVIYPYRSGMVTSAGRFSLTYGLIEFRARIPRGQAMWPALWLLPTNYTWPPEIDVMEAVGQVPTHVSLTLHGTDGTRPQKIVEGPDYSADWHTFGIDWAPGRLTWYVDGVAQLTVDHGVPRQPMYLLANLAVGGAAGRITDESPATATFAVDYVKVWKR